MHEGITVDYFVHTWDFNSMPYAVWTKKQWDEGKFHSTFEQPPTEGVLPADLDEFINTIKPKQYMVENIFKSISRKQHLDDRMIFRMNDTTKWAPISWSGAQLYGIMMAAKLKRDEEIATGVQYDVVMRMRTDLHFDYLNKMIFSNEFVRPAKKTVYACHSFNTDYFPHDAVGDIFFYADSITYDMVANTFNHLPQISPDIFPFDVKVESIMAYMLRMFDIKNVRLSLDPEVRR